MELEIIIDGKKCKCNDGQTILQVARNNGIDIPTLCYLKDVNDFEDYLKSAVVGATVGC